MIRLPLYREWYLRGLLYAFVSSIRDIEDIEVESDYIVMDARGGVCRFIGRVYGRAAMRIGDVGDIPLHSNDSRYLIGKIYSMIGLPRDTTMEEFLKHISGIVGGMDDDEFMDEYYNSERISPLSILNLEYYQPGREIFFRSRELGRARIDGFTLLETATLLSGYLLSKISVERGKALLLLPQRLSTTYMGIFPDLVENYNSDPGVPGTTHIPTLYLWLLTTLPDRLDGVEALLLNEPRGSKPSSPEASVIVDLSIIRNLYQRIGYEHTHKLKRYIRDICRQILRARRDDEASRQGRHYVTKILDGILYGEKSKASIRELILKSGIWLENYLRIKNKIEKGKRREIERIKDINMKTLKVSKILLYSV